MTFGPVLKDIRTYPEENMKIRFVKAFSAALAAVLISSSFAGCSGSAKEINGEETAVIIN